MRSLTPRKALSAVICLIFSAQTALPSLAEANIWEERQAQKPVQMASLGTPGIPFSPKILQTLPSAAPNLQPTATWNHLQDPKLTDLSESLTSLIHQIDFSKGTLQEIYDSGHGDSPAIAVIQDIHMNPEAQMNIAGLLDGFIAGGSLDAVGVEGSFNPIDFSPFRQFQDEALRRQVAGAFLEKKLLAAPSYTGVVSQGPLPAFIGVDDITHHTANVEAYRNSVENQQITLEEISQENQTLQKKKEAAFNKNLLAFDRLADSYHTDTITLGEFAIGLKPFLHGELFFQIDQFTEAYQLEQTLDFNRVNIERKRVVETLASQLSKQEMEDLLANSLAYKSGALSFGRYYKGLRTLCAENGVDLSQTPHFADYIRYVLLSDGIDAGDLFKELTQAEKKIFSRLGKTEEEKALVAQSQLLRLTEKLVKFELTPGEWEEYKTVQRSMFSVQREGTGPSFPIASAGNLIHQTPQKNIEREKTISLNAERWTLNLKDFEAFYEEADIRSRIMSEKLTAIPGQNKVLITGGFHAPEISAFLKKQNISHFILSPKVTKVDDSGSAYLTAFTQEKTPLDQIFSGKKLFVANPLHNFGYRPDANTAPRLDTAVALEISAKSNRGQVVTRENLSALAGDSSRKGTPFISGGGVYLPPSPFTRVKNLLNKFKFGDPAQPNSIGILALGSMFLLGEIDPGALTGVVVLGALALLGALVWKKIRAKESEQPPAYEPSPWGHLSSGKKMTARLHIKGIDSLSSGIIKILIEAERASGGKLFNGKNELLRFTTLALFESIKNEIDQFRAENPGLEGLREALDQLEINLYADESDPDQVRYLEITMPSDVDLNAIRAQLGDVVSMLEDLLDFYASRRHISTPGIRILLQDSDLDNLRETLGEVKRIRDKGERATASDFVNLFFRPFFSTKIDNFRKAYMAEDRPVSGDLGGAGKGLHLIQEKATDLNIAFEIFNYKNRNSFVFEFPQSDAPVLDSKPADIPEQAREEAEKALDQMVKRSAEGGEYFALYSAFGANLSKAAVFAALAEDRPDLAAEILFSPTEKSRREWQAILRERDSEGRFVISRELLARLMERGFERLRDRSFLEYKNDIFSARADWLLLKSIVSSLDFADYITTLSAFSDEMLAHFDPVLTVTHTGGLRIPTEPLPSERAPFVIENETVAPPAEGEDKIAYLHKVLEPIFKRAGWTLVDSKETGAPPISEIPYDGINPPLFGTAYKINILINGRPQTIVAKTAWSSFLEFSKESGAALEQDRNVFKVINNLKRNPVIKAPKGFRYMKYFGALEAAEPETGQSFPIILLEEFIESISLEKWLENLPDDTREAEARKAEIRKSIEESLEIFKQNNLILWDVKKDSFRIGEVITPIDYGGYSSFSPETEKPADPEKQSKILTRPSYVNQGILVAEDEERGMVVRYDDINNLKEGPRRDLLGEIAKLQESEFGLFTTDPLHNHIYVLFSDTGELLGFKTFTPSGKPENPLKYTAVKNKNQGNGGFLHQAVINDHIARGETEMIAHPSNADSLIFYHRLFSIDLPMSYKTEGGNITVDLTSLGRLTEEQNEENKDRFEKLRARREKIRSTLESLKNGEYLLTTNRMQARFLVKDNLVDLDSGSTFKKEVFSREFTTMLMTVPEVILTSWDGSATFLSAANLPPFEDRDYFILEEKTDPDQKDPPSSSSSVLSWPIALLPIITTIAASASATGLDRLGAGLAGFSLGLMIAVSALGFIHRGEKAWAFPSLENLLPLILVSAPPLLFQLIGAIQGLLFDDFFMNYEIHHLVQAFKPAITLGLYTAGLISFSILGSIMGKRAGPENTQPFYYSLNGEAFRKLVFGLVSADLALKAAAIFIFPDSTTFHFAPNFAHGVLMAQALLLVFLILSRWFYLPLGAALAVSGFVSNVLEAGFWDGVTDPLPFLTSQPNLADFMLFIGIGLILFELTYHMNQSTAVFRFPHQEEKEKSFQKLKKTALALGLSSFFFVPFFYRNLGALPPVPSVIFRNETTPVFVENNLDALSDREFTLQLERALHKWNITRASEADPDFSDLVRIVRHHRERARQAFNLFKAGVEERKADIPEVREKRGEQIHGESSTFEDLPDEYSSLLGGVPTLFTALDEMDRLLNLEERPAGTGFNIYREGVSGLLAFELRDEFQTLLKERWTRFPETRKADLLAHGSFGETIESFIGRDHTNPFEQEYMVDLFLILLKEQPNHPRIDLIKDYLENRREEDFSKRHPPVDVSNEIREIIQQVDQADARAKVAPFLSALGKGNLVEAINQLDLSPSLELGAILKTRSNDKFAEYLASPDGQTQIKTTLETMEKEERETLQNLLSGISALAEKSTLAIVLDDQLEDLNAMKLAPSLFTMEKKPVVIFSAPRHLDAVKDMVKRSSLSHVEVKLLDENQFIQDGLIDTRALVDQYGLTADGTLFLARDGLIFSSENLANPPAVLKLDLLFPAAVLVDWDGFRKAYRAIYSAA